MAIYVKILDRGLALNTRNQVNDGEGAGLVLTRKVGERIIIAANPSATDDEILSAIRSGIVISLVEVSQRKGPREFDNAGNRQPLGGRAASKDELGMHATQRKEFVKGHGSARIGFKAPLAISISREEILSQGTLPGRDEKILAAI